MQVHEILHMFIAEVPVDGPVGEEEKSECQGKEDAAPIVNVRRRDPNRTDLYPAQPPGHLVVVRILERQLICCWSTSIGIHTQL